MERFRAPSLAVSQQRTIWIHAVSVGEVITAATLLPALERAFPDARFVVSVITITGRRVAEDKLGGIAAIFYCPFDFAILVRKVLRAVRPRALVVVETEIWPQLLRESRRAGAVTMIAGGRISDRSFPRYRAIRPFMKRFLAEVDRFCMQNEVYAQRITALGGDEQRIHVTGSLKFDAIAPPVASGARVFPKNRRVLVAGSTLDSEEASLLRIFESLSRDAPELFLVLAPRHPRRFDGVAELVRRRGHRVARRSAPGDDVDSADVMILDTLGELASLYERADYVFVGGSLVDWGGHNIIEPASKGKPVVFGPYMSNFADIAQIFVDGDAAVQVKNTSELESVLRDWLENPRRVAELAANAARVIAVNRGASDRTAAVLKELMG
jgi:3-deoxy-D-manno-octulosonic-acid transferase